MWDEADELKDMLFRLEKMKVGIMKRINALKANENAIKRTTIYPLSRVEPLKINNYSVYQFSYEGMLPHFDEDNRDYLAMIRHYYYHSTFDAYDFDAIDHSFDEAFVIFVQYFKDNIIRDLENRNKKYIQDAIRLTGIIKDDNWQNVWNTDIGLADEERNHVQVYVVARQNYAEFFSYFMSNHEKLKCSGKFPMNKEQYFTVYKEEEEQKRTEETKRKDQMYKGLFFC